VGYIEGRFGDSILITSADKLFNWACLSSLWHMNFGLSCCAVEMRATSAFRFDFNMIVGKGEMGTVGDCWDRYSGRILEMVESIKIIRQALQQIPDGPVRHEKTGKSVKVPEGKVYAQTEAPRGELGYYLISEERKVRQD